MPTETEVNDFLDELRERGVTNMFGAVPYIQREFGDVDRKTAKEFLSAWMMTFEARYPVG